MFRVVSYLILLFLIFNARTVLATDNVTLPSAYTIINLTAMGPTDLTQSYSHTYTPNSSLKEAVQNSLAVNSVGAGMSRVHDIIDVAPTGRTYMSSFVGYTGQSQDSVLSATDKMGVNSCCSVSMCGQPTNRVAYGMAAGYSLNSITNGYANATLISDPQSKPESDYNMSAASFDDNGDVNTGVSYSSSSNSDYSQSYSRHIHVTGKYIMYNTAEVH